MDKNERRKPDMKKKVFDIDGVMVCGKEVLRDGRRIAAPLPLLFKVANGGWTQDITVRQCLYRKKHYQTKFRTIADAKRAFAKLAALPAAKSLRDYTTLKYCIIGPKRERMNQNGGISRNF